MKYILFVYPCDDTWDKDVSNLKMAEELLTIAKSDEVSFIYGENHSIFHFESEMCQPELTIFVDLVHKELPDFMYVLVQTSKTMTSNMLPEHLEHLKSINKKGKRRKTNNSPKEIFIDKKPTFDLKKFIEQERIKVEEFLKNQVCDLTIDEILDKISQTGLDSLTRAEKDRLDEYSKQI
jgi:hypothetical protein